MRGNLSRDFSDFFVKNFFTKLGKKSLDNLPKKPYNIHIKIEKEKKIENNPNNARSKKLLLRTTTQKTTLTLW
jgi:hypothetical protein